MANLREMARDSQEIETFTNQVANALGIVPTETRRFIKKCAQECAASFAEQVVHDVANIMPEIVVYVLETFPRSDRFELNEWAKQRVRGEFGLKETR